MNNIVGRAFYFTVVFWGQDYAEYFINLLLASLLAPGNIPILKNKQDSKFVIATTNENWDFIQNQHLFILLKTYIDVIFIDIEVNGCSNKMQMMSYGHKLISELLFKHKVIGVFVTPDLVLSNETVPALEYQVNHGKKVVLCAAIRFEYYGCMEGFKKIGVMKPDMPMNIQSRELMRIALENLHSESKTWLWDEPFYAHNPVCTLFKLQGKSNYIFHGYSWAPLVVDYSAIQKHDTSTFDVSTLDQDYIYKNFGVSSDIYVVTDSDEIALVSFTKESDLNIPLVPHEIQNIPLLGNIIKKDNLCQFHYSPIHGMDPLKRQLVLNTVYLHSDSISSSWFNATKRAQKLIQSAICRPPFREEHLYVLLLILSEKIQIKLHQGRSRIKFFKNEMKNFYRTCCVNVLDFLFVLVNSIKRTFNIICGSPLLWSLSLVINYKNQYKKTNTKKADRTKKVNYIKPIINNPSSEKKYSLSTLIYLLFYLFFMRTILGRKLMKIFYKINNYGR